MGGSTAATSPSPAPSNKSPGAALSPRRTRYGQMRQMISYMNEKMRLDRAKLEKLQEQVTQKAAEEPLRKRRREELLTEHAAEKERLIGEAIRLINCQKEKNRANTALFPRPPEEETVE